MSPNTKKRLLEVDTSDSSNASSCFSSKIRAVAGPSQALIDEVFVPYIYALATTDVLQERKTKEVLHERMANLEEQLRVSSQNNQDLRRLLSATQQTYSTSKAVIKQLERIKDTLKHLEDAAATLATEKNRLLERVRIANSDKRAALKRYTDLQKSLSVRQLNAMSQQLDAYDRELTTLRQEKEQEKEQLDDVIAQLRTERDNALQGKVCVPADHGANGSCNTRLQSNVEATEDANSFERVRRKLTNARVGIRGLLTEIEELHEAPLTSVKIECSICLEDMVTPVVTSCGHTFCANCASGYLEAKRNKHNKEQEDLSLSRIPPQYHDNISRRPRLRAALFRTFGCPTPHQFQPPCPTCRAPLLWAPAINWALKSILAQPTHSGPDLQLEQYFH
ncbi:E3 ubiquitin ligase [Paramarasmius palmivorus]|uniref:E3 ubiquitin ligase n=1 Tax=Paramarasmius palmivorus TaxID=297713 RepID=A0AAW0BU33_9AGAR